MHSQYDVVVMGGSLAGASTALLLKRRNPEMRVLVIEKSEKFDRKVGESTSEVSACFLTRVLGLSNYLGHHHLTKQGLRMWFATGPEQDFTECSEIGPKYQGRLPTYQLDREKLDQHVLEEAVSAGAELLRPAKIRAFNLETGNHTLEVESEGETHHYTARWLVDASGRVAMIGRKLDLFKPLTEHPTNSVWGRFQGVKDWDSVDMKRDHAEFGDLCRTVRTWATNHLNGPGWWCWIIPLRGGDFSVGIVYDSRIFTLPPGPNLGDRLKAHLLTHPIGRMLFENAHYIQGDIKAYSQLPFTQERIADESWFMVGDAAGFMDPLYSPGLDFISYTTCNAVDLISRAWGGEEIADAADAYNVRFGENFRRWFAAIYLDKYYYIGDAELMSAAFLLDVGCYFLGPVREIYSPAADRYTATPYFGPIGGAVASFMRTYNARLAHLGRKRLAAGIYGRKNGGWRELYPGFSPDPSTFKLIRRGTLRWLKLELQTLFLRPVKSSLEAVTVARAAA